MRSRELQTLLSTMTKRPLSEIDQRVRALRMASEINFGPRGLSAPHMSLAEVAFHLLTMASRRASDAGEVQQRLVQCRYIESPDLPGFLPAGTGFASAVSLYLDDPSLFGGSVEMAEDGSTAWITKRLGGGGKAKLLFRAAAATTDAPEIDPYEFAEDYFMGSRFVIGAAVMVHISKQISDQLAAVDAPQLAKAG